MVRTFCYDIPSKGKFNKKGIENRLDGIYKPLLALEKEVAQKSEITKAKKEGRSPKPLKIKDIPPPYCILQDTVNKRMCVTFLRTTGNVGREIDKIHKELGKSKREYKDVGGEPTEIEVEVCEWWGGGTPNMPKGWKWNTLSHNGPLFPDFVKPYKPHNLKLHYGNQKLDLNEDEERVLMYYAKLVRAAEDPNSTVTTTPTTDKVFNANFMRDLRDEYLTKENQKIVKDIKKIKWKNFVDVLNKSGDVSSWDIELAGIFRGRGDNKSRGRIKPIVYPEDVTINIGKDEKVPTPPKGYKEWGEIKHDHTTEFLAKWTDKLSGKPKYVRLASQGQMKSQSDFVKFETARELNKQYKEIQKKYRRDLESSDEIKRQLSTALFLIEQFGIRPGGKKQQEAGVAGATTLKVENIPQIGNDKVDLDFIGKDSVRFERTLDVIPKVAKNIGSFKKGKDPSDQLFDRISASDINDYIKSFNPLFSAKIFRTRLASDTMYKELEKMVIREKDTFDEKLNKLKRANIKVAEVLNHIKTQTPAAKKAYQKKLEVVKGLEKEIKSGKSTEAKKTRLKKLKGELKVRAKGVNVAPETSRKNYIDPRILISWGLKHHIPYEKIYTTNAVRSNFEWAQCQTDEDWDYIETPIEKAVLRKAAEKAMREPTGDKPSKKPDQKPSKKPDQKPSKKPRKGKEGEIYIEDLTDKAIIVKGDTKSHKGELQQMNGKWNKTHKGWIFSKKRRKQVQSYIDSLTESPDKPESVESPDKPDSIESIESIESPDEPESIESPDEY